MDFSNNKKKYKIVGWDGGPQANRSESLKVPSSSSAAAVGAPASIVKTFQGLDGQWKGLSEAGAGDTLDEVLSSSEDVSFGAAEAGGGAVVEEATVVGGSPLAVRLLILRGDQPGGRRRGMCASRCMDRNTKSISEGLIF